VKDIKYNKYKPWIYPTSIILLIITIIPTIFLFAISLFDYKLGTPLKSAKFIGISNYITTFASSSFWHSILITAKYMLLSVGIEMILGFMLAFFLYNRKKWLRNLLIIFMVIPMSVAPSIAGLMWRLNFHPIYGIVNQLLYYFNLGPDWYSYDMALFSVIIIDIWQWTPFVTLISLAGLLSIDTSVLESARIDGADGFKMIKNIIIPIIKPVLLVALIMRSMDSLKMFDVPFSLTEGGPGDATELLSMYIYRKGFFHTGSVGAASAVAVIMLVIIIFMTKLFAINLQKQ